MPMSESNVISLADHRAVPDALDTAEQFVRNLLAESGDELLPLVVCTKGDGERFIIRYEPAAKDFGRSAQIRDIGRQMRTMGVTHYAVCHRVCFQGKRTNPENALDHCDGLVIQTHDAKNMRYRLFSFERGGARPSLHHIACGDAESLYAPNKVWAELLMPDYS